MLTLSGRAVVAPDYPSTGASVVELFSTDDLKFDKVKFLKACRAWAYVKHPPGK